MATSAVWPNNGQESSVSTPVVDDGQFVRMIQVGGDFAPEAPSHSSHSGIAEQNLTGLAIKFAYTVQHFTTEWMRDQMCLSLTIVTELLEELRTEKMIEILGQTGTLTYRFTITGQGRELAGREMEISGYIGPAPVTLDEYSSLLDWQFENLPKVSQEETEEAMSNLVLEDEAKEVIGLALMSGRSLFVHGPPGNGKTSVGRLLHDAFKGTLWIPHCIAVDNSVIRLFDPQCHTPNPLALTGEEARRVDSRWVRIDRPFIVVGGELTIESLDLGYNAALNSYEAPLHLKANGGTFLLDDFGRQRVEPDVLLNRWIIPLERQVDYLTLNAGQKVMVPLRQMLTISTQLDPEKMIDPAFMRRIGYRLYLGNPSPERYRLIFDRYTSLHAPKVSPGLVDFLLARYKAEGRVLKSCEPRDLVERARDICLYRNQPMELNEEIMDTAWRGYFGNEHSSAPSL